MRQRLRIIFLIISGLNCLVLFTNIWFLPWHLLVLYFIWVFLSITTVAFSTRLVKSGMMETIAALLVECFLFTMFLVIGVTEEAYGRDWILLRFAIPFMNIPIWWLAGTHIKEMVDVRYRRVAQKAAREINLILEEKVRHKKKLKSLLEQYVQDRREVSGVISLIQSICEDDSGELMMQLFEKREERITDFMETLMQMIKSDKDYAGYHFTGRNATALLERVTGDIEKCMQAQINLPMVMAADCVSLQQRLEQLKG